MDIFQVLIPLADTFWNGLGACSNFVPMLVALGGFAYLRLQLKELKEGSARHKSAGVEVASEILSSTEIADAYAYLKSNYYQG
jgi:hypothetical protein